MGTPFGPDAQDAEFVIGNRAGGDRTLFGKVFYFAMYDVPFDATCAAEHADILSQSDDRP